MKLKWNAGELLSDGDKLGQIIGHAGKDVSDEI
jgi:hypothetical protein